MIWIALAAFVIGINTQNWLFLLPGTIAHECLHYIVGWFTGAEPKNFTVQPKDGVYGEVWFTGLNHLNALPVAVAPLLAIPVAYIGLTVLEPRDTVLTLIYGWVFGVMIAQSWPSRQDWSIVREYWQGSLVWIVAIFWLTIH